MILDHLGRPIVNSIDDTIFSNAGDRRDFYHSYIIALDKTIGLPRLDFSQFQFNNWIELLNRIQKEFKTHSPLKKSGMSYAEFFNAFFIHPYGLEYQEKGSRHNYIDKAEKLEREDKKLVKFTRSLNVPLLFDLSIASHKDKVNKSSKFNRLFKKDRLSIIYKEKESENLEGVLKAEFNDNYWKNILSNSDDCIFISHNQDEVVFRQYWLASLLHQYHPEINYLSFVADGNKELKKKFPYPLIKVKLMETENPEIPLIVGGVLGTNPNDITIKSWKNKKIEEMVNQTIWRYFTKKFKGKNIFYNTSNSIGQRAVHQFNQYISQKYPENIEDEIKELELIIPNDNKKIGIISSTKRRYKGEQFLETFAIPNEEKKNESRVGAFFSLEGRVEGLSIDHYNPKSAGEKSNWPLIAGLTSLATIGIMASIYLNDSVLTTVNPYVESKPIIKIVSEGKGLTTPLTSELKKHYSITKDRLENVKEYLNFLEEQRELCKGSELLALSRVAEEFNRKLFGVINDCTEVHDNISCCREVGCLEQGGITFSDFHIHLSEFKIAKRSPRKSNNSDENNEKEEMVIVNTIRNNAKLLYDSYDDAKLSAKVLNALAESFQLKHNLKLKQNDFDDNDCPAYLFRNESERVALEKIANTISAGDHEKDYDMQGHGGDFLRKAIVHGDELYVVFSNREWIKSYSHPERPKSLQSFEIRKMDLSKIIDLDYFYHEGLDWGPSHAHTPDIYNLKIKLNDGSSYRFEGYNQNERNQLGEAFRDLIEIYTNKKIILPTDRT